VESIVPLEGVALGGGQRLCQRSSPAKTSAYSLVNISFVIDEPMTSSTSSGSARCRAGRRLAVLVRAERLGLEVEVHRPGQA
jgi:hypothetical protein